MRKKMNSTPPVVKNLLIINALVFLAAEFMPASFQQWMIQYLAIFPVQSPHFMPHQLVTYMFMHAGLTHVFFNMFALWMFGRQLEYDLGSRRFLIYYMICGIGAALIQLGVNWIEMSGMSPAEAAVYANRPTVGASGAVFGILLGFGLMHPNVRLMLLFPPIPMKAKWFVIGYGVLELLVGVSGRMDGVAHFAHVGGMLWGLALLYYWKKKRMIYF